MLITEGYKRLQEQYHMQRPDYGCSGHKWADHIQNIARQLGTRDILDYGCGKQTLQKNIPFPIHNFDPCIAELSEKPAPADLVVCTDVLEHIEPGCLDAVLDDLVRLTKQFAFLEIATRPAVKFLPDGRNAHLVQENINWWLAKLLPRWTAHTVHNLKGSFVFLGFIQQEAVND